MNKLLLLGSVASPCPPDKQGGTERVAYVQAKYLAKAHIPLIFVGGAGTTNNFKEQLIQDGEHPDEIFNYIECIEIGGGTQFGNAQDASVVDPTRVEASRKLRTEMVYLAQILELMQTRRDDYTYILNNLRGEAVILPLAHMLGKQVYNVMHLNIFGELTDLFQKYKTQIITIADHQRESYPALTYAATIFNPVNTKLFAYDGQPDNYALMMGTIGRHKNQKDAIDACIQAEIPLVLCGKIRDQDYFNEEIQPHITAGQVVYHGELGFEEKLKIYQKARVFLFPVHWQEPFGLVMIEALSCGTPVIAYPHGGPAEIIQEGVNGYLVQTPQAMAEKIKQISELSREQCRKSAIERFDEAVIGRQYVELLHKYFS